MHSIVRNGYTYYYEYFPADGGEMVIIVIVPFEIVEPLQLGEDTHILLNHIVVDYVASHDDAVYVEMLLYALNSPNKP